MKTLKYIYGTVLILLVVFLLSAFQARQMDIQEKSTQDTIGGIPEDIMKILENSCFACHSNESQNQVAKMVLDFDKWDELKNTKKIKLLGEIDQVIQEKTMPPKKYLDEYPCKSLSVAQANLVRKWAKEESDKMMN